LTLDARVRLIQGTRSSKSSSPMSKPETPNTAREPTAAPLLRCGAASQCLSGWRRWTVRVGRLWLSQCGHTANA
jgi:hypothetical protein